MSDTWSCHSLQPFLAAHSLIELYREVTHHSAFIEPIHAPQHSQLLAIHVLVQPIKVLLNKQAQKLPLLLSRPCRAIPIGTISRASTQLRLSSSATIPTWIRTKGHHLTRSKVLRTRMRLMSDHTLKPIFRRLSVGLVLLSNGAPQDPKTLVARVRAIPPIAHLVLTPLPMTKGQGP